MGKQNKLKSTILKTLMRLLVLGITSWCFCCFEFSRSRLSRNSNTEEPTLNVNQVYLERVKNALEAWELNLRQDNITVTRGNNPNWITVADETCSANGILTQFQGESCGLQGNIVGVCLLQFVVATGEIRTSTLLMSQSYQDGGSSEEDKVAVFTHEIGHCLGLSHSPPAGVCGGESRNCVMYPTTAGNETPYIDEINALKSSYLPISYPSAEYIHRFKTAYQPNGPVLRHFSFPDFHISGTIGNALEQYQDPQFFSTEELQTHAYVMNIDHTEDVYIWDNEGNIKKQVLTEEEPDQPFIPVSD